MLKAFVFLAIVAANIDLSAFAKETVLLLRSNREVSPVLAKLLHSAGYEVVVLGPYKGVSLDRTQAHAQEEVCTPDYFNPEKNGSREWTCEIRNDTGCNPAYFFTSLKALLPIQDCLKSKYSKYNFSYILTDVLTESGIDLVAHLRKLINIQGDTTDYQDRFTFKSNMISILVEKSKSDNNLKELIPRTWIMDTAKDIPDNFDPIKSYFSKEGYPLFFKPSQGAGSMGTQVIKSDLDLFNIKQSGVLQPFINKPTVHMDIIYDGQTILYFSLGRYVFNCFDFFVDSNPLGSIQIEDESYKKPAQKFAIAILKGIGAKGGVYHLEAFVDEMQQTPKFTFVEIANRMGGGAIEWINAKAKNVDLEQAYYEFQLAQKPNAHRLQNNSKSGFFLMVPKICKNGSPVFQGERSKSLFTSMEMIMNTDYFIFQKITESFDESVSSAFEGLNLISEICEEPLKLHAKDRNSPLFEKYFKNRL